MYIHFQICKNPKIHFQIQQNPLPNSQKSAHVQMHYTACSLQSYLLRHVAGWRRPSGWFVFTGHFSQKSPTISGFFAKNHLQLKASYRSSSHCTTQSDNNAEPTFPLFKAGGHPIFSFSKFSKEVDIALFERERHIPLL